MIPDLPMRAKELAVALGINRRQIFRWRKLGLPAHLLGNSVLYFPDEVLQWMRQQAAPPVLPPKRRKRRTS